MARVRLVHWNVEEAEERRRHAELTGHDVVAGLLDPPFTRSLRGETPDAVVVDLSRLPMQGRDVGIATRLNVSTRRSALVFVGGDPAKVERVRKVLPDAVYTTWVGLAVALADALAHPIADPVVPDSVFAPYATVALLTKLGVQPGQTVSLLEAPDGFEALLDPLPAGVAVRRGSRAGADLTIWFASRRAELDRRLPALAPRIGTAGLWIAWPKRTSGTASDLNQAVVRRAGIAVGLVDYQVCSIDDTWSALRFAARPDH